MSELTIPRRIRRTVELIKKHPRICDARVLGEQYSAEFSLVAVDVSVEMPSRAIARGTTETGVRSIETVCFCFRNGSRVKAPAIALRNDFNRCLPHIMPGDPQGPVVPCVYDGDINELVQQRGMWAVIDHLSAWLDKAAVNELIDPEQGWEPIRRDTVSDTVVASGAVLRGYGEQVGPPFRQLYGVKFLVYPTGDNPGQSRMAYYATLTGPRKIGEGLSECFVRSEKLHSFGCSIAIVVRPDLIDGTARVANQYVPDTVTNSAELRIAANQYGCEEGLEKAFGLVAAWLVGSTEYYELPLVIVLCANRPFPVIGSSSRIELIPYVTSMRASFDKSASVRPAAHRDAIDVSLLKRLSGTERTIEQHPEVTQIGCGSLGSKIAVHLARAGYAPTRVLDRSHLTPHHAARHALAPEDRAEWKWGGAKADALSRVISALGQKAIPITQDVTLLVPATEGFSNAFGGSLLIVNSTASLSVREWLSSLSHQELSTRVAETSIYGDGQVGLMTIEGPARNPNSADLAAYAHLIFSQDENLRNRTLVQVDGIARRLVGQGCGSPTMIVSDMRISAFAAAMAQNINLLERNRLPDGGRLWIGKVEEDQVSMKWESRALGRSLVIAADNAKGWTVRLLESARVKIEMNCAQFPDVETGGVLAGYTSEAQRALIVVDIIPAPEDSVRSKAKFELGTKSLDGILKDYFTHSGGSLYCIGTWHSHLAEQGPSETDYKTAEIISSMRPFPSAMLVKTPSGYRALILNVNE